MKNKFPNIAFWKTVALVFCGAWVVGCAAALTSMALYRPKVDLGPVEDNVAEAVMPRLFAEQRQATEQFRENINATKAEFYVKLSEVDKSLAKRDARLDSLDGKAVWMDKAASNLIMVASVLAQNITRDECKEIADEAAKARADEVMKSLEGIAAEQEKLAGLIVTLEGKVSEAQTSSEAGEWAARKAAMAIEQLILLDGRVSSLEERPVVDAYDLAQLREATAALAMAQTNITDRMTRILKALSD